MKQNCYLYRHIRKDTNEVFYVGIGTVLRRSKNNKNLRLYYSRAYTSNDRNNYWRNIVNITEYEVEILLESDDYEFIKQKEIEFIALYGREDLGKGSLVNLTDGGEGKNPSEESRRKTSEAQKGEKAYWYGKKASEETREKLREARLGDKNHFYLKSHSVETKQKMSIKSSSKKIIDTETLKVYNSIGDATKHYTYSGSALSRYLNKKGKNKTKLMFLSEYLEQNPDFKY